MFIGRILVVSLLWEVSCAPHFTVTAGQKPASHCTMKEAFPIQHYQKGPGHSAPPCTWEGARVHTDSSRPPRAWNRLLDRCPGRGGQTGAWRALLAKAGYERPGGKSGIGRGLVPATGFPHGGPCVRPGAPRRSPTLPPRPARTQLRPRGAAAGAVRGARGHLLSPQLGPRAPRRRLPRRKAARRVRTGALAARTVGSPWRAGGGKWGGAGPHTLPARRRRRRQLAAGAAHHARRMSGSGERAEAARDPVGVPPPRRETPGRPRAGKVELRASRALRWVAEPECALLACGSAGRGCGEGAWRGWGTRGPGTRGCTRGTLAPDPRSVVAACEHA